MTIAVTVANKCGHNRISVTTHTSLNTPQFLQTQKLDMFKTACKTSHDANCFCSYPLAVGQKH